MKFVSALLAVAYALDNGLGLVPQMGWNTWNKFACSINQELIQESADSLIQLGLRELGYNHILIDDCWMEAYRTTDGHMVPTAAFPNGMKAVGDFLHTNDLKFGIYSSAGTMTCQQRAGSLGYEMIDAADWASWGVDYLKYDNCFNNNVPALTRYPAMREALAAQDRPIFYSICNWGEEGTWHWGPEVGNSFRTTEDIFDGWASIEFNFKTSQEHFEISRPGAWNDPDMLEIGNGGLTVDEEKTHFALWALAKAPLIIGCDLTTIRAESLAILKNSRIIAVNQDPNSTQASCMINCDWWSSLWRIPQAYATKVTGGDTVAIIVNWREVPYEEFTFSFYEIGVIPKANQFVEVTDLWTGVQVGTFEPSQIVGVQTIAGHGNSVFRFHIVDAATQ